MSHPLLPKNINKDNALFRQGKPDYIKLEAAAFPTPTADEAGAILENSDTGDRFRWTSTVWVQIVTRGNANIYARDYWADIVDGLVPGEELVSVNARNPQLIAGTAGLVTDMGGIDDFATAGETWEMVVSNAADTAAGTGAQEVTLYYMDDVYERQTLVIATSGVGTTVLAPTDMFRFFELETSAAGSGSENAGDITIQVSGGGTVRGLMTATFNRSFHGAYTIPVGFSGKLITSFLSVKKGKDVTMAIQTTRGDNGIYRLELPSDTYQAGIGLSPKAPLGPRPEKTDLRIVALDSANNTAVNVFLQLHLKATI